MTSNMVQNTKLFHFLSAQQTWQKEFKWKENIYLYIICWWQLFCGQAIINLLFIKLTQMQKVFRTDWLFLSISQRANFGKPESLSCTGFTETQFNDKILLYWNIRMKSFNQQVEAQHAVCSWRMTPPSSVRSPVCIRVTSVSGNVFACANLGFLLHLFL